MKKLSETYKELGIAFKLPIVIEDANGNLTYHENSDNYWAMYERDANGKETYFENSNGTKRGTPRSAQKWEHDFYGNEHYYETSDSVKRGTPRSAKTCEGKVIEVDGIKYELKAL